MGPVVTATQITKVYRSGGLSVITLRLATLVMLLCGMLVGAAMAAGQTLPDGGIIAYSLEFSQDFYDIYLMDIRQIISVKFVTDEPHRNFMAAWSPDGEQLAYVSSLNGRANVYVAEMSGASVQQITDLVSSAEPAWSPDGQHLVVSAIGESSWELLAIDTATGGSVRQLTDDGGLGADWSPDGTEIVFENSINSDRGIHVLNLNTLDVRQLTEENFAYDAEPKWSPDGQSIAFISERRGRRDIYVMDSGGGNVRQLTVNQNVSMLDWSPDGQSIVYTSHSDGDGELFVINADGSGRRQLTWNEWEDIYPTWRP
jgi:TolB protein